MLTDVDGILFEGSPTANMSFLNFDLLYHQQAHLMIHQF